MTMRSAVAYLRTLREARGLSQEDIARAVDVSVKTVWNWETQPQEIPSTKLAAFLRMVEGSAEDVISLLNQDDATPDDGRRLAQGLLSRKQLEQINERVTAHGADVAIQAATELLQSPEILREIIRRIDEQQETLHTLESSLRPPEPRPRSKRS